MDTMAALVACTLTGNDCEARGYGGRPQRARDLTDHLFAQFQPREPTSVDVTGTPAKTGI